MGCLRVDGLGVLVKRMGCLGCWWSLSWERGRESGQVVEGGPRESGEGAGGRLPGIFFMFNNLKEVFLQYTTKSKQIINLLAFLLVVDGRTFLLVLTGRILLKEFLVELSCFAGNHKGSSTLVLLLSSSIFMTNVYLFAFEIFRGAFVTGEIPSNSSRPGTDDDDDHGHDDYDYCWQSA